MPRVTGFLHVVPESDLSPGHDLPSGGVPGHDLPSGGHPWVPGHLPSPPPNIWPPLTPSAPIQPAPPGTPPGTIWPPVGYPGHDLPGSPGHPSQGLPSAPARPDAGLPTPPSGGTLPVPPPKTYWVVAGIPGVGWRYVAIDPSLVVGYPLPPTAAPKG